MRIRPRCLAAICASLLALAPVPAFTQSDPANLSLTLVNEARDAEGLFALSMSATLRAAAQAHAEDMAARNFYAHATPEGLSPRDRYIAAGGNGLHFVAENIARCQPCDDAGAEGIVRRFQELWLESAGHRRNIMRRGAVTFGFGIASHGSMTYAVQMFAGAGPPDEPPVTEAASAEDMRRAALAAMNAQRQQSGFPVLEGSPALDELAHRIAARTFFDGGEMTLPRDPFELMPEVLSRWPHLATAAWACSGCGNHPTVSDASSFAPRLTGDIGADYTHAGFALVADGQGRKIAIAVFARP